MDHNDPYLALLLLPPPASKTMKKYTYQTPVDLAASTVVSWASNEAIERDWFGWYRDFINPPYWWQKDSEGEEVVTESPKPQDGTPTGSANNVDATDNARYHDLESSASGDEEEEDTTYPEYTSESTEDAKFNTIPTDSTVITGSTFPPESLTAAITRSSPMTVTKTVTKQSIATVFEKSTPTPCHVPVLGSISRLPNCLAEYAVFGLSSCAVVYILWRLIRWCWERLPRPKVALRHKDDTKTPSSGQRKRTQPTPSKTIDTDVLLDQIVAAGKVQLSNISKRREGDTAPSLEAIHREEVEATLRGLIDVLLPSAPVSNRPSAAKVAGTLSPEIVERGIEAVSKDVVSESATIESKDSPAGPSTPSPNKDNPLPKPSYSDVLTTPPQQQKAKQPELSPSSTDPEQTNSASKSVDLLVADKSPFASLDPGQAVQAPNSQQAAPATEAASSNAPAPSGPDPPSDSQPKAESGADQPAAPQEDPVPGSSEDKTEKPVTDSKDKAKVTQGSEEKPYKRNIFRRQNEAARLKYASSSDEER